MSDKCPQFENVDYTKPCTLLPLDRAFQKSQSGGRKKRRRRRRRRSSQRGGKESVGYYLGVGQGDIGGRPEVIGYDTCNAPTFPVNCRNLRGGKPKRRKHSKRKHSKRKHSKRKHSKRKHSNRKPRKSRKSRKSRRRN